MHNVRACQHSTKYLKYLVTALTQTVPCKGSLLSYIQQTVFMPRREECHISTVH